MFIATVPSLPSYLSHLHANRILKYYYHDVMTCAIVSLFSQNIDINTQHEKTPSMKIVQTERPTLLSHERRRFSIQPPILYICCLYIIQVQRSRRCLRVQAPRVGETRGGTEGAAVREMPQIEAGPPQSGLLRRTDQVGFCLYSMMATVGLCVLLAISSTLSVDASYDIAC